MSDDSFKQDSLSRSGLIGFIELLKEDNPKNMTKDSYHKIKCHLYRLNRFKEVQEHLLRDFKEVLVKY